MDITTRTTTNALPTIINSQSLHFGRILLQISIVKITLLELKIDVNDDISAAIMTANINPRAPGGIKFMTIFG